MEFYLHHLYTLSYSDTEVTTFSYYYVTTWYEDGKITAPHEHMHKQTKYAVSEHNTPLTKLNHIVLIVHWTLETLPNGSKLYWVLLHGTHARACACTHTHTHTHTHTLSQTPIQCHPHLVNRNSLLYSIAIYHHTHHTVTNNGEQTMVAMYCDLTVYKCKLKNSKRKSHCEIYVVDHKCSGIL